MDCIESLNNLRNLEPNWDTYGAPAIAPESIDTAIRLARFLPDHAMPEPSVVPTSGGGVQLEWHQGGFDIEVEFLPSGEIECEIWKQSNSQ
jgi:hypothetical protein